MTTYLTHSIATTVPRRARGCRCETPWRSDDTCARCGHRLPENPQPAPRQRRSAIHGNPWTQAGIVRALRTYEFFVGQAPTATGWAFETDDEWPSVRTVLQVFGSFEAAVEAAGLTAARSSP
jgi:hypothetical protein